MDAVNLCGVYRRQPEGCGNVISRIYAGSWTYGYVPDLPGRA